MKTPACRTTFCRRFTGLLPVLLGVLVVGGLLLGAQLASAQTSGVNGCIQDVWAAHGNTQSLTCTANDVRIAEVTNITILSGGSGTCTATSGNCTCNAGGTVTFTADFEVLLGAQARYDVGLYIATDGDPNGDGALTGQCFDSVITSSNSSNFDNLDGDVCGDIDATHNPQLVHLMVSTACVAGPDGKLKLPNCTSWRQPGSNTVCTGFNDAYPGSPSKCNCQPQFEVNVLVEHPTISVTKSANPTSVQEPGGPVTYTVHVTNNGSFASVTLTQLAEDDNNDGIVDFTFNATSTPSLASICGTTTLAPGASTDCTFMRTVSGEGGTAVTDKACVSGTDSNGGPVGPTCSTAVVSITDVPTSAAITKTPEPAAVCATVRYDVKVTNTSPADTLTLSALSDNVFGDITMVQGNVMATNCGIGLPATLAANGGTFTCKFDGFVCGPFPKTDTVTGTLTDDDGKPVQLLTPGSATVNSVTVQ